jgi:hypothetical protein
MKSEETRTSCARSSLWMGLPRGLPADDPPKMLEQQAVAMNTEAEASESNFVQ